MQYDVFISYSRKDYVDANGNVISGNIVSKIKDVLKENGISYWIDEDGIYSGDDFAKLIANSIKNSRIVVFVSSENSNKSEWTRKEIATALSYKKKIIPFRYDETPFNESVGFYISDLDFISYATNGEKAMKKLVTSIKQYLISIEESNANEVIKTKIEELEREKSDLDDRRKAMLNEIEKTSVVLDSLKTNYNDIVDKTNKIEKELCRLDKNRTVHLVDKLKDEQPEQKNDNSGKLPMWLIALLAVVFVYAVVISVVKFGKKEMPQQIVDNEPVVEVQQSSEPEANPTDAVKEADKQPQPAEKTTSAVVKKEMHDATIKVNGVSFEMVAVKGGTFRMGATSEQADYAQNNEKPVHNVTIDDYCIGKYEVTQAQWNAVMGVTVRQQRDLLDSSFKLRGEGELMPIYYVSWNDCQEFIKKLNALTGKKFRLPTEAEWEYAARGGSKAKGMLFGDSSYADNYAWFEGNSDGSTHVVGYKTPNVLGIYDMLGNVGEWCQDKFGKYANGSVTNPKGPSSGYDYVVRGGSWASTSENCRVSSRSGVDSSIRTDAIGFRLVME